MTKRLLVGLCTLAVGVACSGRGSAQSVPTATQGLELSVFGAGTGTYTGLHPLDAAGNPTLPQGRNASITAGIDLAFRRFYGFRPALELRGTKPFDKGLVDGQTSGLIGLRIMKTYGRFNPYLDGLFGRGQIDYVNGFIVPKLSFRYDRTTTNVFVGGGGVDFRITQHFDAKADIQFERWTTPVATGSIYPKPISLGIVYHLDFNQYGRHHEKKVKYRPEPVVAEPVSPPPPPPGAQPPLAGTPVPADTPLPTSSTSAPPPQN